MKRYLSMLLAVILFIGAFSINVVAVETTDVEPSDEIIIYSSYDGYILEDTSGPYIKVSVRSQEIEKKFLWATRTKYIFSVCFEVFEDKEQTVCIAQYQSKGLESRREKSVKDIIEHDDVLKNKDVYDLLLELSQLECEVATLETVCENTITLQEFYVDKSIEKLAHSSVNSVREVVNEIVFSYFGEVFDSVKSSLVEMTASCIKEFDMINESTYENPNPLRWWQIIKGWFIAWFTSDDKQDTPDDRGAGILAQAYAKTGKGILESLGGINMAATYGPQLLETYRGVLENDKTELKNKHSDLCKIIIDLDTESK